MATYTINNSTITQTTGFTPVGTLAGGDVLIIPSSWTNHLYFLDITGASGNPITITNPPTTKISITETMTVSPWGSISFARCKYMVLDGSNYLPETYGIYLENGYFGLRLYQTEDIEIKYAEINSIALSGIQSQNGDWTQLDDVENVIIHHNYIHDIATEGIYLGSSDFTPSTKPSYKDCKIYSNIINNCGWDGIQLGAADQGTNEIYKNRVDNCGTADVFGQDYGIIMNPYSKGNVYQNMVIGSNGSGIQISGTCGDIEIHDNVVIDSGRIGIKSLSYALQTILNNTIVNSDPLVVDYEGISTKVDSTNGIVMYNLVVGTSKAGQISTIYSVNQDNLTSNSIPDQYFLDVNNDNVRLTSSSPAKDYSSNAGYSPTDFDGTVRPVGTNADAGAFEYVLGVPYARSRGTSRPKPKYNMVRGRFR